jgi:DNA primase
LVAIEDVIARYVPLRRGGQNYLVARCPFHEDRNPSFVVYPQTQSFYCFGCREHGDVLSFLMRMEHLTFPEALNVLREL